MSEGAAHVVYDARIAVVVGTREGDTLRQGDRSVANHFDLDAVWVELCSPHGIVGIRNVALVKADHLGADQVAVCLCLTVSTRSLSFPGTSIGWERKKRQRRWHTALAASRRECGNSSCRDWPRYLPSSPTFLGRTARGSSRTALPPRL